MLTMSPAHGSVTPGRNSIIVEEMFCFPTLAAFLVAWIGGRDGKIPPQDSNEWHPDNEPERSWYPVADSE